MAVTCSVDPGMSSKIKLFLNWGNTTGSSVATVATSYRLADIPIAS